MGLDNYASKYVKRVFLDTTAIDAFLAAGDIGLCGYVPGGFRGKRYHTIVETITNETLYSLLDPYSLAKMAKRISLFLQKLGHVDVDTEIDVRSYFEDYREGDEEHRYSVSVRELCGLRDFFRVCAENELYLHPDF